MIQGERKTFTVLEAAKTLGVARNLVYEGVRSGQIPAIHLGKRILISRTELARLLGDADLFVGSDDDAVDSGEVKTNQQTH